MSADLMEYWMEYLPVDGSVNLMADMLVAMLAS